MLSVSLGYSNKSTVLWKVHPDREYATADKIVTVCATLTNLYDSLHNNFILVCYGVSVTYLSELRCPFRCSNHTLDCACSRVEYTRYSASLVVMVMVSKIDSEAVCPIPCSEDHREGLIGMAESQLLM